MSALDHINTARNPTFAARVTQISLKVAQAVATEAPTEPNHTERVNYANITFRGDENPKMLGAHMISSNPTMQATIDGDPAALGSNIPDNDIEFALSSIWTARAVAFASGGA